MPTKVIRGLNTILTAHRVVYILKRNAFFRCFSRKLFFNLNLILCVLNFISSQNPHIIEKEPTFTVAFSILTEKSVWIRQQHILVVTTVGANTTTQALWGDDFRSQTMNVGKRRDINPYMDLLLAVKHVYWNFARNLQTDSWLSLNVVVCMGGISANCTFFLNMEYIFISNCGKCIFYIPIVELAFAKVDKVTSKVIWCCFFPSLTNDSLQFKGG